MNDFDRRYLLAHYPTGGVVVDLESGNYFRINASAALVCEAMRVGVDVEERIAVQLDLPRPEAARILAELTAELARPQMRGTPQGSYHFFPAVRGYVLKHGDRIVLEVDATNPGVSLPLGTEAPEKAQLDLYVRALAPKLLFQRGITVLHAAACLAHGHLLGFAGVSGAGKTTTARACVDAGARSVAEDLLVLKFDDEGPHVFLDAERFIDGWARQTAAQLLRSPAALSYSGLWRATEGPTARLRTIVLLDRSRRRGTQLSTRRFDPPDALAALMMHDFLGAADPDTWRRFFKSASDIVAATEIEEATMPAGIEYLPLAVGAYMAKYAS